MPSNRLLHQSCRASILSAADISNLHNDIQHLKQTTSWHVATDVDGTVLESHCNGLMRQEIAHIKLHNFMAPLNACRALHCLLLLSYAY